MTDWSQVASAIGAVNILILGFVVTRLADMDKKLDQKQTKEDCRAARDACQRVNDGRDDRQCGEIKEIWVAFAQHSHSGLPADSKVTR